MRGCQEVDPAKSDALIHHFDAATGDDVDSTDAPTIAHDAQPEPPAQSRPVTKAQVAYLKTLIKTLVSSSFCTFNYVYALLRKEFDFSRCEHIPAEKFEAVCAFLEDEIASSADDEDESGADSPYSLAYPAPVKTPTPVKRLLVCVTDEGSEMFTLKDDEIVARVNNLAGMIDSGVLVLSHDELVRLATACLRKAFPV